MKRTNASLYVFSVDDPVTVTAHVWAFHEEEAAQRLAALFASHDDGDGPLPITSFAQYRAGGDHPRQALPYVESRLVWNCGQQITADDIAFVACEVEIEGGAA